MTPLVSCMLVTNQPQRIRWAKRVVDQFVAQTYVKKELIIVNGSGHKVLTRDTKNIKEITDAEPELYASIGSMRNLGLSRVGGDLVKLWDDDDIYDPLLLAWQVGCFDGTKDAALCDTQVRVDIVNSKAFSYFKSEGIFGTILYKPDAVKYEYTNIDYGTDLAFWVQNFSNSTQVISSGLYPYSVMHLAVYQGHNVCPVEYFMDGFSDAHFNNQLRLDEGALEYVKSRLAEHGLIVQCQD